MDASDCREVDMCPAGTEYRDSIDTSFSLSDCVCKVRPACVLNAFFVALWLQVADVMGWWQRLDPSYCHACSRQV